MRYAFHFAVTMAGSMIINADNDKDAIIDLTKKIKAAAGREFVSFKVVGIEHGSKASVMELDDLKTLIVKKN